jgi:beta-glucosidase
LRGFQRVNIPAGHTSQVTISLPPAAFEFYNKTTMKMAAAPGDYEILYGNSSRIKDLKVTKVRIR